MMYPPISEKDFHKAVKIAATSRNKPIKPQPIKIIDETENTVQTITLTDIPINRIGVALAEAFPDRDVNFLSIFISIFKRFQILAEICEDERAKDFIKESKDKKSVWISDKLINHMAKFKINKNGKINKKEFFKGLLK